MQERAEFVTADDGCRLWTARTGPERDEAGARDAGDGRRAGSSPADHAPRRQPPIPERRHGFVLCHGGPAFWDTLGPLAAMVEDLDPAVRWDQRGGGRSQWQGPYSVARFLDDLDRVREHHGFEEVTLIGHSWGATLALHYALAHPARVRDLVYVAGIGLGQAWRAERSVNTRAALEPYRARIAELEAQPRRTAEQERLLLTLRLAAEFPDRARALENAATQVAETFDEDDGVSSSINAEMDGWSEADLVERCARLAVPVLIIDGARDVRPRWSVDSLAQALPDCTRVSLPASGHFPWLDEPEDVRTQLRRFVQRRG